MCSHLASGGKEGDLKYRNSNVAEILSRTIFPRGPSLDLPTKILHHEYVFFLPLAFFNKIYNELESSMIYLAPITNKLFLFIVVGWFEQCHRTD